MLITTRLRLRQWTAADLGPFAALNADPVVMELMPRCLTRVESDELARNAAAEIEQRGWGLWAVHLLHRAARCPNMRAAGAFNQPRSEVMART